jgi:hypothetical protein
MGKLVEYYTHHNATTFDFQPNTNHSTIPDSVTDPGGSNLSCPVHQARPGSHSNSVKRPCDVQERTEV